MLRRACFATILLAVALTGCNANGLMPANLMGAFLVSPQAAGAESMKIFSCTQVGFSATACAGGNATAGDLNNWQKFSNMQGQAGYHYYAIENFNVGGKQTPYWIYEKP